MKRTNEVNMPIVVGESFKSYREVEKRILQLERDECLSLWRRDSRTIKKAKAKGLKHHINEESGTLYQLADTRNRKDKYQLQQSADKSTQKSIQDKNFLQLQGPIQLCNTDAQHCLYPLERYQRCTHDVHMLSHQCTQFR